MSNRIHKIAFAVALAAVTLGSTQLFAGKPKPGGGCPTGRPGPPQREPAVRSWGGDRFAPPHPPAARDVERLRAEAAPAEDQHRRKARLVAHERPPLARLRAHLLEVMIRDQAILVPVAGVLIVMLLAFLFRSFRGVAVPSIAAVAPALMLFGIMG